MATTPVDDPVFPPELEREIFETSALLHHGRIPSLLRVAHRVHIWIEPLLYRVIQMDKPRMADVVRHAMQTKPASFFQDNVRYLWLSHCDFSQPEVCAILRLCPQLVSLVLFITFAKPELLPILQGMPEMRKWRGPLGALFGSTSKVNLRHPFFRTITHMDLYDTALNAEICVSLGAMPALTHLCLNDSTGAAFLRVVFEHCANLRVVFNGWTPSVVNLQRAHKLAANPPISDPRFVVGIFTDYRADWQLGAHGGGDFWAAADEFVERKRKGEIEASCYFLDLT